MSDHSLNRLPPVNTVLGHPDLAEYQGRLGRERVVNAVRQALDEAREALRGGRHALIDPPDLARRAVELLEADRPRLRRVLNASGILLHTGLGRAPLAAEAIEAVVEVARGYCNLELDLESGRRGTRSAGAAELLCRITGAPAATVVNNNAAATLLALRVLAAGREVVVSRGQLVEIGGSFRIPEILEVSGARLREVGTTNRTRLSDYANAIGPETASLLRVHASNYRIVGFTESVPIADLAELARSRGIRAIDDVGSGALRPGFPPLEGEPTVAEGIAAGADLVLCSGDKLLGGPQCGLMLGSHEAVSKVQADPLYRALRVDKMTLAALEATLRLLLDPARVCESIPLWKVMTLPLDTVRRRAEILAGTLRDELNLMADAVDSSAYHGGGSVPGLEIPSASVRISPPFPAAAPSDTSLARALRLGEIPVVARVQGGAVLLDLRTLAESDDQLVLEALRQLVVPES